MNLIKDKAIRSLYPNIVTIDGDSVALDADGNGVSLDEDKITAESTRLQSRQTILDAIKKLESQETPRRLSEALPDDAGGSAEGRAWLKANRDKIITERDKL